MAIDPKLLKHAPELLAKVRAEKAKNSLKEFTRQAWPILEPGRKMAEGWVLDAICEHLEAVTAGDIRRLVITVPPGSMKSLLTRVFWPAWQWVSKPNTRFIGASYALSLAERDNTRARTLITSDWYKNTFGVEVSPDQASKVNFGNTKTGFMMASSVGGAITGFRADAFIVDDPLSVAQGDSEADRNNALIWFKESMPTRLNDLRNSSIVIIAQRVHAEDVPAVAVEMGYEHLNIPMHYDPDRHCSTSIGWTDPRSTPEELMWPERFPAEAVKELEDALGPYAAAAQLEQNPVPRKGAMFQTERIETIDSLPDEPFITVRAWDLAGTDGAGAYTVGVRIRYGQKSNRFYIDDVQRARLASGGVRKLIEDTAIEDGHDTKIILPQDPGQAGKAQIDDLVAMLAGFNARAEAQSGSKVTRAEPLSAQVERGNVTVLQRTWTKAFVEELRFFPRGKYKDQVDAASSAFNALATLTRKHPRNLRLVVDGERQENWAAGTAANG